MEFHLTYSGVLSSSGSREVKHQIRRQLHPQLKRLWLEHPALSTRHERIPTPPPQAMPVFNILRERGYYKAEFGRSEVQSIGLRCLRPPYRFVPLVNTQFQLTCAIDILFLRRGNPGQLVLPGGDIDNRIKVLLDGLRVPSTSEVVGEPTVDEDPFFCLVEDDSLITALNVKTDRLLTPDEASSDMRHPEHQVFLVMRVSLIASRVSIDNLQMLG